MEPDYCPINYTYEDTKFKDSSEMDATAITQDDKTSKFFWDTDKSPLGQTQTVTITGTSYSIYGPSTSPLSDFNTFDLTFVDPCVSTDYVSITEPTQLDGKKTDNFSGNDVVFTYNPPVVTAPSVCLSGNEMVTCNSFTPENLILECAEIDIATGEITWNLSKDQFGDDLIPAGTYTFTYDVSTSPGREEGVTKSFTVELELVSPCPTLATIAATAQDDLTNDKFSGNELTWTLKPFTVDPPACAAEYECTSIKAGELNAIPCDQFIFDGEFDEQETDGKATFTATTEDYTKEVKIAGTYEITITGKVVGSDPEVSTTATFGFVLEDPCDPPVSFDKVILVDQTYSLNQAEEATYTHEDFIVVPDYCPIEYTYEEEPFELEFDSTAISRDGKTYTFSWTTDLSPIGTTQRATVIGTTKSIYGEADTPLSD